MNKIIPVEKPGNAILRLCQSANKEAVLVAPFIKKAAFDKILSVIPRHVSVYCVTRWHPQEVAAGISDPDIWHSICQRSNSSLWLRQDLHAKYYRLDASCLVGSANITQAALGWSKNPNLELLISYDSLSSDIVQFEATLKRTSVRVDSQIYSSVVAAAAAISSFLPKGYLHSSEIDERVSDSADTIDTDRKWESWIPSLRHPKDLYIAYSGSGSNLSRAAASAAEQDLRHLEIPPGLDEQAFLVFVGSMLLQQSIVQELDAFVGEPKRFGAVTAHLSSLKIYDRSRNVTQDWQALMRWLLYFLPDRYERSVPRHSEIFSRKT